MERSKRDNLELAYDEWMKKRILGRIIGTDASRSCNCIDDNISAAIFLLDTTYIYYEQLQVYAEVGSHAINSLEQPRRMIFRTLAIWLS